MSITIYPNCPCCGSSSSSPSSSSPSSGSPSSSSSSSNQYDYPCCVNPPCACSKSYTLTTSGGNAALNGSFPLTVNPSPAGSTFSHQISDGSAAFQCAWTALLPPMCGSPYDTVYSLTITGPVMGVYSWQVIIYQANLVGSINIWKPPTTWTGTSSDCSGCSNFTNSSNNFCVAIPTSVLVA